MNFDSFSASGLPKLLLATALATSALMFAGCVVSREPHPRREVAVVAPAPEVQGTIVVQEVPPPLRVEVITARPSPQHVWIKGHWRYANRGYVWEAGRWAKPPRHGAMWVEPRWETRNGKYVFIEGSWR